MVKCSCATDGQYRACLTSLRDVGHVVHRELVAGDANFDSGRGRKSKLPRGPRYRGRTFAVIGRRGQAEGALHSRTTENSIAAAKKANTRVRERIIIVYHDA